MVGWVRASSSECPSATGEIRKNTVEAATEMAAAMSKLRPERLSRSKSVMPIARPMPMMGPISGEMSIAPMMTAVELVLRPSEATRMANTRI